jgi:lipopolysaccharide/colanic/teichoic acid biosynthesis glycosyltransferase
VNDRLKRFCDIVVGLPALLALLPLIAVTGLLVRLFDGRPVLFHQVRVGRFGTLFTMPKFRTMREAYDEEGLPLCDEDRVTPLGRFLRRSRLDDLLGLLPVLTGHMSLVGPRPLPPSIVSDLPGSEERALLRPGITGLAQVSGNTLLTDPEKIAVDIYYVRNRSLGLDVLILCRTVGTLLRGERRDEALIRKALEFVGRSKGPGAGRLAGVSA